MFVLGKTAIKYHCTVCSRAIKLSKFHHLRAVSHLILEHKYPHEEADGVINDFLRTLNKGRNVGVMKSSEELLSSQVVLLKDFLYDCEY